VLNPQTTSHAPSPAYSALLVTLVLEEGSKAWQTDIVTALFKVSSRRGRHIYNEWVGCTLLVLHHCYWQFKHAVG
jgi:hypothetical protein